MIRLRVPPLSKNFSRWVSKEATLKLIAKEQLFIHLSCYFNFTFLTYLLSLFIIFKFKISVMTKFFFFLAECCLNFTFLLNELISLLNSTEV